MGLPNADRAEVDLRKLSEYCLSTDHPVGRNKAVVFLARLGLTANDAERLHGWLMQAAASGEAVEGRGDEYGQRYRIDFEASTDVGIATIRSAWIVTSDEDFPRFVTCFVFTG